MVHLPRAAHLRYPNSNPQYINLVKIIYDYKIQKDY